MGRKVNRRDSLSGLLVEAGSRICWRSRFVHSSSFVVHECGTAPCGGAAVRRRGHRIVDPVWSDRVSPVGFIGPKRVNDPGIPFDALPRIDVVLVSHNHYDHLDAATLSRLAAVHRPRVITPFGNNVIMQAHDPAIAAE